MGGTWGAFRGHSPKRRLSVLAEAEHLALAGPGEGALRSPAARRSRTLLAPGASAAPVESCVSFSQPVERACQESGAPRLPSALRFYECASEVTEEEADFSGWEEPSPRKAGASGAGHLLVSALCILCKSQVSESVSPGGNTWRVLTPALPPSSDCTGVQGGKPFEEPNSGVS